ncbi:MAG: YceI family protein [Bacteroidetes bacterium]|nr:YceI family protein [Bacteroidota bacterium]
MEKNTWVADPMHSEILFKVRHLMITNVKGEFRNFTAKIHSTGADFSNAEVHAQIDTTSIFTNSDDRDTHLKGADFFDVTKYPDMLFDGSSFEKLDDENYQLKGMLTIKGIAKEITLSVEFGGINKDPYGQEKAGFTVTGKINRKDWGLNWNAALESGGVLVSDEVRLNAELQFIKK